MLGHVWHCARVELRGGGQRAGVVAVTDDAGREHVGHDMRLGRSARLSIFDPWRAAAAFCRVFVSAAISLQKFTIRIALYVRHLGKRLSRLSSAG